MQDVFFVGMAAHHSLPDQDAPPAVKEQKLALRALATWIYSDSSLAANLVVFRTIGSFSETFSAVPWMELAPSNRVQSLQKQAFARLCSPQAHVDEQVHLH